VNIESGILFDFEGSRKGNEAKARGYTKRG